VYLNPPEKMIDAIRPFTYYHIVKSSQELIYLTCNVMDMTQATLST